MLPRARERMRVFRTLVTDRIGVGSHLFTNSPHQKMSKVFNYDEEWNWTQNNKKTNATRKTDNRHATVTIKLNNTFDSDFRIPLHSFIELI